MKDGENRDMNRDQAMQDIQTIKSFLEQGQRKLEESGFHFIFWGLLIPAGFVAFSLIAPYMGFDSLFARFFWPVLCGIGAVVSLVAGMRSSRSSGSSRYADSVSSSLWIGNIVALAVLFMLSYLAGGSFSSLFLASLGVILGLAYWVYGTVISLRWFSLVGLLWWGAAITIALLPIQVAGVVLASATFVCSFIPGCILFTQKKKGGH